MLRQMHFLKRWWKLVLSGLSSEELFMSFVAIVLLVALPLTTEWFDETVKRIIQVIGPAITLYVTALRATKKARTRLSEVGVAEALKTLDTIQTDVELGSGNYIGGPSQRIAQLEKNIVSREKRIWLSTGDPLNVVVKNRLDASKYDTKLGIVHQVQTDLLQLSEALMSSALQDSTEKSSADLPVEITPEEKPCFQSVVLSVVNFFARSWSWLLQQATVMWKYAGNVVQSIGREIMRLVHRYVWRCSHGESKTHENKKCDVDNTIFPRGKPRIVLFVDDLDRVHPDKVVETLEALQLLVKTDLFVVVVAMNLRYVTNALECKYEKVLQRDSEPSGLQYLEKIVQIPYQVPAIHPDMLEGYLAAQMTLSTEMSNTKDEEPPPEDSPSTTVLKQDEVDSESSHNSDSYFSEEDMHQRPAPAQTQSPATAEWSFMQTDLQIMKEVSTTANIQPRSGRRLVNIFKVIKITWHDLKYKPAARVEKAVLLLLAFSTSYPVVMGGVLTYLEEKILLSRLSGSSTRLDKLVRAYYKHLSKSSSYRALHADHLIKDQTWYSVSLEELTLANLRLVRSFSFVGGRNDDLESLGPSGCRIM